MGKIIVTFDIAEKGKHLVVSEDVAWKGLCKSASILNGNKSKKVSARNMEMNPGLNTVELELEDAENICDNLFMETEIKSCIIPEGVKSIGCEAFSHCENLESVSLPSTLKSIASGAFYHCENLKSISLPSTLEEISANAFKCCSALQKIVIPASVKKFTQAFGDYDINMLEFAPGREELPKGACNSINNEFMELAIPEGITSMKRENNFRYINIKEFKFPSTLREIETGTFRETTLGHMEWPAEVPVTDQDIQVTGGGFAKLGYFALPQVPDTLILTEDYNCDTLVIPANVRKIELDGNLKLRLQHIYVDPDNEVYDSRNNCNAVIETATNRMILAGEHTTVPEGVVV